MPGTEPFQVIFRALTGNDPFPWQEKLFSRLVAGDLPRHCDVPTGLGKTSAIAVWLAALAESLSSSAGAPRVPRRLAYVVDRRAVVDQATEEVERLRECLRCAATNESLPVLHPVVAGLATAATLPDDCGVTVSTLRGKFADNHAWHLDPSRPAIVVGTVDMIGSRMLFGGYGGIGRNWRSLHAGLLVQDTWVVLDEAHLVPSFEFLLQGIEHYAGLGIAMRPFGVTRMSATLTPNHFGGSSSGARAEAPLFTAADTGDARVAKRLNASKSLRFVLAKAALTASKPAERLSATAETMAQEAVALAEGKNAVAVFADTVNLVKAVTAALEKATAKEWPNRVLMLTGEMRGAERDNLTENQVLKAFFPKRERSATRPAFLVATACVEVGMDFDADHCVCDAVALERMIQRFGRVNRRGETDANIHLVLSSQVIAPAEEGIEEIDCANASVLMLRKLPSKDDTFDASPAALRALDFTSALARRAFSRPPVSPPLDEARLDDWALTSVRADEFPRPKVSYWLRGVTEDDSLTTSLVWRADLRFAASREDASAMVDVIAVAPREVAQIATHRAATLLSALAEKHENAFLAIRSASGESRGANMSEFRDPSKSIGELMSATVFLPCSVGGMVKGIPDVSAEALRTPVVDVVDEGIWHRAVFTQSGAEIAASLLLSDGQVELLETCQNETEARNAVIEHVRAVSPKVRLRFDALIPSLAATDDESSAQSYKQAVAYFQIASEESPSRHEDARSLSEVSVTLMEHTRVVEAVARTLGERLGLTADLCEAVVLAARWHDRGKDRSWWQAAIGNRTGESLAKSGQPYFDSSLNAGYRHEFGSLVEARADETIRNHPQRELILHLIAAHHGHARPAFPPETSDRSIPAAECAAIAAEVPGRFAALQQQYGWWTLAWLESLVKCADAIASAHPEWKCK